jgi:glycosyltransferase involved in cell wall biosynthesis
MPAYNAARTLRQTYDEVMAHGIVDLVIVVDDASHDETVAIARTLSHVQVEVHPSNRGYGANQKTCYRLALAAGADIIVMIHPDYQYTPQLLPAMAALVASGLYPVCLLRAFWAAGHFAACRGGSHFKPVLDVRGERSHRRETFGVSLAPRFFAPAAGTVCRLRRTRMTLSLIIKSSRKSLLSAARLGVTCPARYMPDVIHYFRRSVRYGLGCRQPQCVSSGPLGLTKPMFRSWSARRSAHQYPRTTYGRGSVLFGRSDAQCPPSRRNIVASVIAGAVNVVRPIANLDRN